MFANIIVVFVINHHVRARWELRTDARCGMDPSPPQSSPSLRPRRKWGFVRTTIWQQNHNIHVTPHIDVVPSTWSAKCQC